ncbi:MAG: hypothetical protein IKE73_00700 [Bacilli bacterium]|nr:hypothetical protein [Bacilli bacterium]
MENNNIEQFGPVGLNAAPAQGRNENFEKEVLEKLDKIYEAVSKKEKVEEVSAPEEKLEDTQVIEMVEATPEKKEEVVSPETTEVTQPADIQDTVVADTEYTAPTDTDPLPIEPTQVTLPPEEIIAEPEKEFSTVTVDSISNDILAETKEEPKSDFIDINSLIDEVDNRVIPYEEPKNEEIKEVSAEPIETEVKPIEAPEVPVIEPAAPVAPVVEAAPVVTPVAPVTQPVVESAPVTPIVTNEQTIEPAKEEAQVVSTPVEEQTAKKGYKDVTLEYVGMTLPETAVNTKGTAERVLPVDSNEALLNKESQASKTLVNNLAA